MFFECVMLVSVYVNFYCQVVEPLGDINCGSDDDSTISGPAIELLPSVRGLIKTAAALIRRTKKLVNDFHE